MPLLLHLTYSTAAQLVASRLHTVLYISIRLHETPPKTPACLESYLRAHKLPRAPFCQGRVAMKTHECVVYSLNNLTFSSATALIYVPTVLLTY
jgi:hypothetical protein